MRTNLKSKRADIKISALSNSPSFDIEKQLINKGYNLIAGVDEAGRGALAGPLSVGIVIFDRSFILYPKEDTSQIDDSKKLSYKKRIEAEKYIKKHSLLYSVELVSHKLIDELNINRATEFALNRLLSSIKIKPEVIIMDGNFSFKIKIPFFPIPKGDSKSISIASASVMAKVRRDKVLEKMDYIYPGYDLKKNKGYGTKKHMESIFNIGFSPIHRRSYEPVKTILTRNGF